MRSTYTAAMCDVVIVCRSDPDGQPKVYMQNFDYDTQDMELLPQGVRDRLNAKHVQVFEDMRKFSAFLVDYPAVVDNCWVIK